jgi:hypothetical protein
MQSTSHGTTRTNRPAWRWPIIGLLSGLAAALLVVLGASARAQEASLPLLDQRGGNVKVVAGQISDKTYGLYLVDYEKSTICVYQFLPNSHKLRLMAARTYRYDVQLDEFNTHDPLPREVRDLVQQQKRLGSEPQPAE